MKFSLLNSKTKLILILQSIAMLMGATTHIMWAVENGFFSEKYNAQYGSTLFWDSLTFLDPLAALLLIVKPIFGLYLTLMIIAVDVFHNNLFYFDQLYFSGLGFSDWIMKYWMIFGQIIFFVFALMTFKGNRREILKKVV